MKRLRSAFWLFILAACSPTQVLDTPIITPSAQASLRPIVASSPTPPPASAQPTHSPQPTPPSVTTSPAATASPVPEATPASPEPSATPTATAMPSATPSPSPTQPLSEALTTAELKARTVWLWEVTSANGTRSWLAGTIHIPYHERALPEAVITAMRRAEHFYMEVNLNDTGVVASQVAPLALDFDQGLKNELTTPEWAELEKRLQKLGLSSSTLLSYLRPWYVNLLLNSAGLVDPASPIDRTRIMDTFLHTTAQQQGLALNYLETAEQQMSALANTLPPEEHLALLRKTLASPPVDNNGSLRTLVQLYNAGDISGLVAQGDNTLTPHPRYQESLLQQRNTRWIEKLKPRLLSESSFVAAGALHMVGPQGLVEAFKAEGYTVRRLIP